MPRQPASLDIFMLSVRPSDPVFVSFDSPAESELQFSYLKIANFQFSL